MRLGRNYWRLWSASAISNLGDGVAQIAYPWLASAVTRDPILIALIAVSQRLPWLVFTLPAGVITDRLDRRRIMWTMNAFRTVLTGVVAAVVFVNAGVLPDPAAVAGATSVPTNWPVYTTLLVASLLFGFAEVLYDNSAQTILPAIVEPDGLERANGTLWGAEMVANSFLGPPLGSLLIGVAFFVPFVFDLGSFAVAAALIFLLAGSYTAERSDDRDRAHWRAELAEGVRWLWRHPLLRPLAIVLGLLNGLFMVAGATFILFVQEILEVDALVFAVLGMAGAIGGVLGSVLAPRVSARLGSGPSLSLTLIASAATTIVVGLASHWAVVFAMFVISSFVGILWNVITVSLRQTIIPDRLLGRVNSVYRFFGWGMMPIGLLTGGILVSIAEATTGSRELALRLPYFVVAAAYVAVFAYAAPRLTSAKIETARAEAVATTQAREATFDDGEAEPPTG